jgi:hypothetical protein
MRQWMSFWDVDVVWLDCASVAVCQAVSSRYSLVPWHLLQSKLFLCLCTFPMEKAARCTSEIASKEPNMCKKNYTARELVRKIK